MLYTPRFSYRCPETTVCHGVPVPSRVVHAVSVGTGWVRVWVYRVGNGRAIPGTHRKDVPLASGGMYSEAAPEVPSRGLEWVVHAAAPRDVRHPPLRGPVGSETLPGGSSSKCPSRLIGARFDLIFSKVSQNRIVSLKYV